jgi:hypothetical protein
MLVGGRMLIMATELRRNFTLEHMRECSPAHEKFFAELEVLGQQHHTGNQREENYQVVSATASSSAESRTFVRKFGDILLENLCVDAVPQCFGYDRGAEMRLYKLSMIEPSKGKV